MRLFMFDGAEIAAITPDGVAMRWDESSGWIPPDGSAELGRMVLSDERAIQLSEANTAELMASLSIPLPLFRQY